MYLNSGLLRIWRSKHCFRRAFNRYQVMNCKTVKIPVKQGIVVGQEQTLICGLEYKSFLGIPYAEPPLGKLRFRSPVPLERFSVPELNCSKHRDVCLQRDPLLQKVVGSENCLFLNIYAPKTKNIKALPVMVFLHGGGFCFGNGNSDYYFPVQLMKENILVITLNYRLGALGFLYLPEEGIYGNAGLKDQRLALQWIQENISNFGGDPNNVTLLGESAGAVSVHLHAYAQHSHKLFHKIILQSGTANMEWSFQQNPLEKTHHLAELLGYETSMQNTILQFLQSNKVTTNDILANTLKVQSNEERRRGLRFVFKPVIENITSLDSFISTPLLKMLKTKNQLQNLPTLLGYNSAEGITLIPSVLKKLNDYDQDFARVVPLNLISYSQNSTAQIVAAEIRDFYFKGQKLSKDHINQLVNVISDYVFIIELQYAAELHACYQTNAPLYFYRFDYVGERNIYKKLLSPCELNGACHGDELFYIFQIADDNLPVCNEDELMTRRICQMWANFARYGNPSIGQCKWTPVKIRCISENDFQLDYLVLDKNCEMRQNPDVERMQFWRYLYSKYNPNRYLDM